MIVALVFLIIAQSAAIAALVMASIEEKKEATKWRTLAKLSVAMLVEEHTDERT